MLALLMVACGFQLRGKADFSYNKIYFTNQKLAISGDLIKALKTNGVTTVNDIHDAPVAVELMSEIKEKKILSLGNTGAVREYEIFYRVTFRIKNSEDKVWGAPQTVEGHRDFSYLDIEALAKSYEEAQLYEEIKKDLIREIILRFVAFKPNSSMNN
jgi:LPS-assembly lipoprotein